PAQCQQRMLERHVAGPYFWIIVCEQLQYADAPHLVGLLCTRNTGPCRPAAEKGDELAPPHADSIARRAGLEEHAPDHSHVAHWHEAPRREEPLRSALRGKADESSRGMEQPLMTQGGHALGRRLINQENGGEEGPGELV